MKLPVFLGFFLVASAIRGAEFDPEPLDERMGARLEILSFLLSAGDAAAILARYDGSEEAAGDCLRELSRKVAEGEAECERVYRESIETGKWTFERKDADGVAPISLQFSFSRDVERDRIWAYGFVEPHYRFEDKEMKLRYAGEMTLVSSDFAPGQIKLLGAIPAATDRDERSATRVRVLFGKLSAAADALESLPARKFASPVIGIVATEVMLPLSEYRGVDALGLDDAVLLETVLRKREARVIGIYHGETVHQGRIRQRVSWGTVDLVEPNYGQGCLFDCDPVAVGCWKQTEDAPLHPPADAQGVVVNWFGWERVLSGAQADVTRTFQWDENWTKPGVQLLERKGPLVNAGGQFAVWLPDETSRLAAVSMLGNAGAKDRKAVLLFIRAYVSPQP